MKKQTISLISAFLFSLASLPTYAQQESASGSGGHAYIKQYELSVNERTTNVLIFPAAIVPGSVDRGSADIIAKIPDGVTNVLKVKAATTGFQPTNLTVITGDNKVYSFHVAYNAAADSRPIDLRSQQMDEAASAYLKNRSLNDAQIQDLAAHVATRKNFMNRPKAKAFGIVARLKGIYIADDVMFYQIGIKNKTQIGYDTDFFRFYVRDKKRMKRTAQQEQELKPLFVYREHGNVIAGKTQACIVVAFKKFTIADHMDFILQSFEKNGDRNPELKISGEYIVKARLLEPNQNSLNVNYAKQD